MCHWPTCTRPCATPAKRCVIPLRPLPEVLTCRRLPVLVLDCSCAIRQCRPRAFSTAIYPRHNPALLQPSQHTANDLRPRYCVCLRLATGPSIPISSKFIQINPSICRSLAPSPSASSGLKCRTCPLLLPEARVLKIRPRRLTVPKSLPRWLWCRPPTCSATTLRILQP